MSLAVDSGTQTSRISSPPPPPPPSESARDVVAAVTDPKTGQVDTAALGQQVADAARVSPEKASDAYAAIEGQLSAGDLSRFHADTAKAMKANEDGGATYSATTPGIGADVGGRKVLRDNPILEVQWRSTQSPVNGKSGFSGPLERAMDQAGIRHDFAVNPPPANGNPVNTSASKTHNGHAARDQIADQLRQDPRYSNVLNEKDGTIVRQTSLGERHVDITATRAGARPEDNVRVEIESKSGPAAASRGPKGNLAQVAKDGERIAENVNIRNIGAVAEGVGKVARPVGVVVDAVQIGQAVHKDGGTFGENTQRATGSLVGGAAGAWGGAQAGAAIGSLGGPVGTVVGGVVGAAVGGIVGSGVGEKAVDWVRSWF